MTRSFYSALGYSIIADFPLTLFQVASTQLPSGAPELFVELEESNERFDTTACTLRTTVARQTIEHPSIEVFSDGDEWTLVCEQGDRHAQYSARGDGSLRVKYRGFIAVDELAAPLEGPALGMALRLQGETLLHASSVRIGTQGLAFSGVSGQGKSTLAATLLQHGAAFWGDDILRVLPKSNQAFPDGRAARLFSEAARQSAVKIDNAPLAHLGSSKRKVDLANGDLILRPHSLDHFFVLDRRNDSDHAKIEELRGAEAVMALMYSRYPTWLRNPMLDARDFDAFADLAQRTQIYRLSLPNGLEKMNQAAKDLLLVINESLS